MLISKDHLRVHHAASKDESRPALNVVKFSKEDGEAVAVATDSYILAEVRGTTPDDSEYPETPLTDEPANAGHLSRDQAKKLLTIIPKKRALPVLEHALLTSTRVVATDLTSATGFSLERGDISFPEYKGLIPDQPPKARVKVSPELLKRMAEVMAGEVELEVEFHGPTKPLVFKAGNHDLKKTVLVMPMRDS